MASEMVWTDLMAWKDGDMRLRLNPRRATVCFIVLGLLWLWWQLQGQVHMPGSFDLSFSLTHLDQAHTIAALAVVGIAAVGIVKLLIRR